MFCQWYILEEFFGVIVYESVDKSGGKNHNNFLMALISIKFNVVQIFGQFLLSCYNYFIEQNTQYIVV